MKKNIPYIPYRIFHTLINLLKNSLDRFDRYYLDLEEERWRRTRMYSAGLSRDRIRSNGLVMSMSIMSSSLPPPYPFEKAEILAT